MIVAEVGSRSPKTTTASFTTTNSWLHSCQKGKKCMNGPFSHDFLSSSSGSDINDLFEGKATFKVPQAPSRGDLLLGHSMYCSVLWSSWLRHRKSNHFNFRWCKKYSGVKGDGFTHGYLLQSFMNLACAVQSVKFLVLIGYFSSTLMHHTTAKASVLVWRTWYANWVQYVPAFILSQLGVWLMAMNLRLLLGSRNIELQTIHENIKWEWTCKYTLIKLSNHWWYMILIESLCSILLSSLMQLGCPNSKFFCTHLSKYHHCITALVFHSFHVTMIRKRHEYL